jgi:hypothetical protein
VLTIEFEPPTVGEPCECCGGQTTRLTRYVHWDGDAYAVYCAMFSDNHPNRFVSVLISIGDWADVVAPFMVHPTKAYFVSWMARILSLRNS